MPFSPKFVPNYAGPTTIERVVAGFCYLSFGLVGLLYLLLTGQANKQTSFLQFNFLQAILLGFIGFLAKFAGSTVASVLGGAVGLISPAAASFIVAPIALLEEVITFGYLILVFYGTIWAFLGKQPEIPVFSKLVRQQMR